MVWPSSLLSLPNDQGGGNSKNYKISFLWEKKTLAGFGKIGTSFSHIGIHNASEQMSEDDFQTEHVYG